MLDKARVEEQPTVIALTDATVNPDHIKIIEGSTDILLIAPHACIRDGEPKDDENTGPITEAVARQIGCSAIINTHYHKPDDKEYPPGHKPKKNEYPHGLEYSNLDLNFIDDAKPELVPGYLRAIRDVVGEPGRPGKTTVIWIHGADDKKAEARARKFNYPFSADEIHAFIGHGQGKHPDNDESKSRHTADVATVERFRDALIRNRMNAVLTNEKSTNYRGRRETGMNQWFRNEGYTFAQVESIQLEIRKGGFRDLHHNIEKTAGILIEALSQEALVPVIPEETVADDALVDLAFNHLRGIFAKHIHEAMLQAGRYLVRTFFGTYEKARKWEKIRAESLHQLIKRLSEASGKAPQKTWIYDAVKLAVDDHYFRSIDFRTYGHLGHSQKILITRVADRDKKRQLVEKAVDKEQTVKQLRESIRALNPPKASATKPKGRFRDWTDYNVNICTGCENDCRYCYAKSMAMRFNRVNNNDWGNMTIRKPDVEKNRTRHNGLVGFPSSHDILPSNLDDYLTVLGKLLRADNEVLIVSKPRMDCIKPICDACRFFKDKILFRFTIGAMDNAVLDFWEPNAPTYEERKACLKYAFEAGFKTSVSMEPMLDTGQIDQTIERLRPYVNQDIWLGTMNHIKTMKKGADERLLEEIAKVEAGQSPEVLTAIHDRYEDDRLIKWKTEASNIIEEAKKKKFSGWPKTSITTKSGDKKDVAAPVIISATRRSDIPACYADEFMESLRHGQIRYNLRGKWHSISFENTRFIVFWTKNPRPLIQHLDEIDQMGYGYYFLYTLNDYEQEGLEPHLPALQERIDTFKMLAARIGKERVVWRFDPLILADKISRQALVDKVGSLMTRLAGHTEKLVFSFLDPNLYNARNKLKTAGYEARVFSDDEKAYIAMNIAEMAEEHGIQAAACADPTSLSEYGIHANKCVDDALIRRAFSQDAKLMAFLDSVAGVKDNGQREHCCCIPSKDIGIDNTCRNGCVYCYANASEKAVQNQLKRIEENEALLAESTQAEAVPAELN